MVFIYCLLSFISEAADNEHNLLLEIPVERSIFECNIQKSLTRSGDLTSFVKPLIFITISAWCQSS